MAKKQGLFKRRSRQTAVSWLCSPEAYDILSASGYTRLADNPEVQMAVNYVADLISSMTIHLMQNTERGDVRVMNTLARKVDIYPWRYTTRKDWMFNIVRNAMIEGNQVVLPHTENGLLQDLEPLAPSGVSFISEGGGYYVRHKGKRYEHDEVLHFLVNPDPQQPWLGMGYRAALREIVGNLRQATATKKAFMESKWKPSVIVRVMGLAENFSNKAGRKKLLTDYVETSEAGEPWVLPSEEFEVQQVKPLSLNDLAINDAVTLDKKTVAGILGVPAFVVGAGEFNAGEHRNFIDTRIMPRVQMVQQELTRKLLVSPDMYWKLSGRALYGYNMKELAEVAEGLYVRGLMEGNEVRGWIDLPPKEGLDKLVMLENYIPAESIGKQKKLVQEDGKEET